MRTPSVLDRGWTRPGPTATQQRRDLVVAAIATVTSVVSVELLHSFTGTDLGAGGVEAYLLFGLAGAVLAVRRRLPLAVLAAESALFVVIGERLTTLGAAFTIQMIMFAALYAAWAWSGRPRLLAATTGVVLVVMFGWLVIALVEDAELPPSTGGLLDPMPAFFVYSILINVVYFAGAIAWGQAAYASAGRRALLAEQRATERRLVQREQQRALHDERLRIARDLHDVVAHHVSSIGVTAAGAGRVLARNPDAARSALGTIETSSRQAVGQMHELVGLLRQDDDRDGIDPQPGLGGLPALAGDPVAYRQVGDPFDVPATVGASLYRVAQEAVTNVRRHSGARQATLVLRYLDAAVEVEVTDDGHGADTSAATGYGLRGIAERAALHGGTTEIGPRPRGGFRVRVRIPVAPA